MKTVILAGGLGTRISEESDTKPKPMINIGGMPILWHIMKQYSFYGFNEFIICAGYKQESIKEWFNDYFINHSDVTFDFTKNGEMQIHNNMSDPWKVTVVDTGLNTMTGGRIKRVQKYINNEQFMLTYGDGVSNINISDLVKYHNDHKKKLTLTAVNNGQRFGILDINKESNVTSFREKSDSDGSRINAGFMVCQPEVIDYIDGDETIFERKPLEKLASENEIAAYKFDGFWQCMDTLRDKNGLEKLWDTDKAPWKVWK